MAENDDKLLDSGYKLLTDFGPSMTAKILHIAASAKSDKGIAKLAGGYRGFFDRVFRSRRIMRIYAPIWCGFIDSYIERSFVSYISKFKNENGECLAKEWIDEFHYHYWSMFVKTYSALLTREAGAGEIDPKEIAEKLLLFKHMPVRVGESQYVAFLEILANYPCSLLSRREIEDFAYASVGEWKSLLLPPGTSLTLAQEVYRELFNTSAYVNQYILSEMNDNPDVINQAVEQFDSMLIADSDAILDREYIFSILPATPIEKALIESGTD